MILVQFYAALSALSFAFGAGALFAGASRGLGLIGLIVAAVFLAVPYAVAAVIS